MSTCKQHFTFKNQVTKHRDLNTLYKSNNSDNTTHSIITELSLSFFFDTSNNQKKEKLSKGQQKIKVVILTSTYIQIQKQTVVPNDRKGVSRLNQKIIKIVKPL